MKDKPTTQYHFQPPCRQMFFPFFQCFHHHHPVPGRPQRSRQRRSSARTSRRTGWPGSSGSSARGAPSASSSARISAAAGASAGRASRPPSTSRPTEVRIMHIFGICVYYTIPHGQLHRAILVGQQRDKWLGTWSNYVYSYCIHTRSRRKQKRSERKTVGAPSRGSFAACLAVSWLCLGRNNRNCGSLSPSASGGGAIFRQTRGRSIGCIWSCTCTRAVKNVESLTAGVKAFGVYTLSGGIRF